MIVRALKVDITPAIGVELCGFANRAQPALSIHDPLYCKILSLGEGEDRLLLLQFDLIGLDNSFAIALRHQISSLFDLPVSNIQLFASHTHSGPGSLNLNGCGEFNPDYLDQLNQLILEEAKSIQLAHTPAHQCEAFWMEGKVELGINRRKDDPEHQADDLGILALRTMNGDFAALLVNYAMHPVCLKSQSISADYPGQLSESLSRDLPGNPIVLFALAPCGDIDPPEVGVSFEQMNELTQILVQESIRLLQSDPSTIIAGQEALSIKHHQSTIAWPTESLNKTQIERAAQLLLQDTSYTIEFGANYPSAIEVWKQHRLEDYYKERPAFVTISLDRIEFGKLHLLFINAELFSVFNKLVKARDSDRRKHCIISCANGLVGYLPDKEQYQLGGYEVDSSHIFYNSARLLPGALEALAKTGGLDINR